MLFSHHPVNIPCSTSTVSSYPFSKTAPQSSITISKEYFGAGVGDNDQLDCIEVGLRALAVGSVRRVKVLGVLVLSRTEELSVGDDRMTDIVARACVFLNA